MTTDQRPLPTYRLYHRQLQVYQDVEAATAADASAAVGWLTADVWARVLTPGPSSNRFSNTALHYLETLYKEVKPNG